MKLKEKAYFIIRHQNYKTLKEVFEIQDLILK